MNVPKKISYFLSITFLALSLFILAPISAFAADYTVSTTDDEADSSPTCTTGSSTDCSLREAVIAANTIGGANTITVPAGTYRLNGLTTAGENAAASGDLDITSTMTITGAGTGSTIIDGNDTDRIFEVRSGASFSLNALTVTNGTITGNAGGIHCNAATLNLDEVIVSYNTASSTSGGIYTSDCSLAITNSTLDNNTATSDGGAMFVTITTGNTITITDSSFTNNTSNRLGGAIEFNQIGGSQFTVLNRVTFSGNSSTGGGTTGGGALEVYARVYITNSTFINNHSDTTGGAIEAPNNGADQLVLAHSTIVQNTAGTSGGGMYVGGSNASVQVQSSIIAANTATTSGSDCFASAGLTSGNYNFFGSISGCTFTAQDDDDITTGARSYMATVVLADNGGEIQTLNMSGPETLDIIPPASCFDAAGAALTTDARGMTRPQSTNCDRGAYEKDQTNPTVSIISGTDAVECVSGSWTNVGATVTDNFSTGLTASVTSGSVNANIPGTYPILYTSTADGDGNTGTNTRTVTVSDTTAPTITVTGETAVTHEAGTVYADSGATATDSCDSTITVNTAGSVLTSTLGAQTLTYTASDDSSNVATEKTRTVTVQDTIAPTITLVGDSSVTLTEGDVYTDSGATATDSFQGDVTASIITTNPVDTSTAGTYSVTYNVSDSSGNAATAVTRTVTVEPEALEEDTVMVPEVIISGKYVKVVVDGVVVDRVKVGKKSLNKRFCTLKTTTFYNTYTTVVFLKANKTEAKLIVLRLTDNNELKKKVFKTFAISTRSKLAIQLNTSEHHIIAQVGKGKDKVIHKFRLTKQGKLNNLN